MSTDSQRTFAIIVTIEDYKLGPGWNHLRTVEDGVLFARWLCKEEKVPAKSILFLATPRDQLSRNALEALTSDCGIEHQNAGPEEIKTAFKDWLPERVEQAPPGECAFYFYWAGHGVIDKDDLRCLICHEADADSIRVFTLKSVQKVLRWKKLERLRRQMFFVDACAAPESLELLHETIPGEEQEQVAERPMQFPACSAAPGHVAVNQSMDEETRFLSILLEALRRASRESIAPDMDSVAAWIDHKQRYYRAAGRIDDAQPWIDFRLQEWNNRVSPKTIIPGDDYKTRKWVEIGLDCLLPHSLEHLSGCYRACGGRGGGAEMSEKGMLEELSELPERNGVPRILELLIRVGLELPPDHAVNETIKKAASKLGLGETGLAELRRLWVGPKAPFYLYVEIPSTEVCGLRCRVYDERKKLWYKPRFDEEITPTNDSVRAALCKILHEPGMRPYLRDLHIELFVPIELLSLDIDLETDPYDRDFTLGGSHRVALRWIDRGDHDQLHLVGNWIELTEAILKHRENCPPIKWAEKQDLPRRFSRVDWVEPENISFFTGFSFDPFHAGDVQVDPLLEKALSQGLPFGLWGRDCGEKWNGDKSKLAEAIDSQDWQKTLLSLRKLRRHEYPEWPRGFALFWDDPERGLQQYGGNRFTNV